MIFGSSASWNESQREHACLLGCQLELVGEEPRVVPACATRAQPRGQRIERRRRHPQRAKDLRADVLRVRRSGDPRDDLSEELVRKVRVLPLRVNGDGNGDLGSPRKRAVRVVFVDDVRPVRARRLALEAGLMRQHPPNRQRLERAERALRGRELREIGDRWIVERQLPRVAKLHDRRRGERLRDRGDAVERFWIRRTPCRLVREAHAS